MMRNPITLRDIEAIEFTSIVTVTRGRASNPLLRNRGARRIVGKVFHLPHGIVVT